MSKDPMPLPRRLVDANASKQALSTAEQIAKSYREGRRAGFIYGATAMALISLAIDWSMKFYG